MKHKRREPGLFREDIRRTEMIFPCNKTFCSFDLQSDKLKFSGKRLNKRTLEDSGDDPMSKYCAVLEEVVNITSTNGRFLTIQHAVATYEQTRRGFSHFHPKIDVEQDEIHTRTLNI